MTQQDNNEPLSQTIDADSIIAALPYKLFIGRVDTRRGGEVVAGLVIKTDLSPDDPDINDMVRDIAQTHPELNSHDDLSIVYIPLFADEDDPITRLADITCV